MEHEVHGFLRESNKLPVKEFLQIWNCVLHTLFDENQLGFWQREWILLELLSLIIYKMHKNNITMCQFENISNWFCFLYKIKGCMSLKCNKYVILHTRKNWTMWMCFVVSPFLVSYWASHKSERSASFAQNCKINENIQVATIGHKNEFKQHFYFKFWNSNSCPCMSWLMKLKDNFRVPHFSCREYVFLELKVNSSSSVRVLDFLYPFLIAFLLAHILRMLGNRRR